MLFGVVILSVLIVYADDLRIRMATLTAAAVVKRMQ
jgi:hypothetical protein